MGVEVLLLFGLGITGVVLTNLLSGEATAVDTRPPVVDTVGTPATDAPAPVEPPRERIAPASPLVPTLEHEPPHLWGHPAPIARLLALLALGAVVLSSAVWGLGWVVARAIVSAVAGG